MGVLHEFGGKGDNKLDWCIDKNKMYRYNLDVIKIHFRCNLNVISMQFKCDWNAI